MRNEEICNIEERDLKDVQNILIKIFNNTTSYDDMVEFYSECKDNKNVYLYGYYINDKLVGMIFLDIAILPSGRKAVVWNLGVLEEYRSRGIATKLITEVENTLKEKYKDIKNIKLFSGTKREKAHKLYDHLGYEDDLYRAYFKGF